MLNLIIPVSKPIFEFLPI